MQNGFHLVYILALKIRISASASVIQWNKYDESWQQNKSSLL